MKIGYKRMLLFQFVILLFILFNSFISSILTKYGIVIFLIGLLLAFKHFFGTEKDRNRFTKDILMEILIIIIIFFIIYYLLGMFFGFSRVDNYYTLYGIATFIIPIIITTILKEYLRYNMIKKSEGYNFLIITTCLIFTLLDITNVMNIQRFNSAYDSFIFIALTFLPALCNNIAATYISIKAGYKPNIAWLLIIRLYYYLLPIVPAPSDYIYSIIIITLPLIIGYRIYSRVEKVEVKGKVEKTKKSDYIVITSTLCLLTLIIFFTCGYFKYYAMSIGSGSMYPQIKIGDVVIVEKLENKKELQVGDIAVFKYHDVTIVHRIVKVIESDKENYYYTKGDDNENEDNYIVYEDMIVAKVLFKIPYIGYPAIWLNNL